MFIIAGVTAFAIAIALRTALPAIAGGFCLATAVWSLLALQKQRLAAQVIRVCRLATLGDGSFEAGERLVDLPVPQMGAPARDQVVVTRHPWQNSFCVSAFRAPRAPSEAGTRLRALVLPG